MRDCTIGSEVGCGVDEASEEWVGKELSFFGRDVKGSHVGHGMLIVRMCWALTCPHEI